MNPNKPEDYAHLRTVHRQHLTMMQPHRENRRIAIRSFLGSHFGDPADKLEMPLNLLEQANLIYVERIAGSMPQAFVRTAKPDLRTAAYDLKAVLDEAAIRLNLDRIVGRLVQEGIFSMGIAKVGMTTPNSHAHWWSANGQPFVDVVDAEDWVQDMNAKIWEQLSFMGNRYRIPLEEAQECDEFNKKIRQSLQGTPKSNVNQGGDEKADTLTRGSRIENDELEEQINLWEYYLPRQRLIVTFPEDEGYGDKPLRVAEWTGSDEGPFIQLIYEGVPGSCIPLPPVAVWLDLHDLANSIERKLASQANRMKITVPFVGGTEDDVERFNECKDGNAYCVHGKEPPKESRSGGPDQGLHAFRLQVRQDFSQIAGNLDTLGGLAPLADTASQENLMASQSSQRIITMRKWTEEVVSKIFKRMAYYVFAFPGVDVRTQRAIPGVSEPAQVRWNPQTRQGSPLDYDVRISAYSMEQRTPEQQLGRLMQTFQQIVAPMAGAMQQQGIGVDFKALFKMIGELGQLEQLDELLTYQEPPQQGQGSGGGGEAAGPPTATTRTYERVNRPGANPNQQANAMMQILSGGNPQSAEMETVGRPMR